MNRQIRRLTRLAMFGLVALTAAATFGSSARADEHDRDRGHDRGHWREAHHWDGFYRRPDVYYSAPPVVYPPYGYYQQPGVSLNFVFPIR